MTTKRFAILIVAAMTLISSGRAMVEEPQKMMVRLAKLEIHAEHLDRYKAALKEEIEDSIRIEPGVIALRAVAEKANPARITIMEIYASVDAYKAHIATPHFLKYKVGTEHMVKSLELVEVDPIMLGEKGK